MSFAFRDCQAHDLLQTELEQVQKRLTETEKEHTKLVHQLNKDILDLENLVEAKIYREVSCRYFVFAQSLTIALG